MIMYYLLERHTLPSGCNDCPYVDKSAGRCSAAMVKDAFDLIKRQQAEIERLTQENNALNGNTEKYIEECETRSRQIAEGYRKEIKSEAVREFSEKLKEHSCSLTEYDEGGWSDTVSAIKVKDIDRLVEGMACNDG